MTLNIILLNSSNYTLSLAGARDKVLLSSPESPRWETQAATMVYFKRRFTIMKQKHIWAHCSDILSSAFYVLLVLLKARDTGEKTTPTTQGCYQTTSLISISHSLIRQEWTLWEKGMSCRIYSTYIRMNKRSECTVFPYCPAYFSFRFIVQTIGKHFFFQNNRMSGLWNPLSFL